MTLLLASIRRSDVLVSADGRCIKRNGTRIVQITDNIQKIFPVPNRPLAIAHHGENEFSGVDLKSFLDDFFVQFKQKSVTPLELADELRTYAHPRVRGEFNKSSNPKLCGFWITGFGRDASSPGFVEIFWRWDGKKLHFEEKQEMPTTVIAGGNGQNQTRSRDWKKIEGTNVEDVSCYHAQLLQDAIAYTGVLTNSVGGRMHEILITPTQWAWRTPP